MTAAFTADVVTRGILNAWLSRRSSSQSSLSF